MSWIIKHCKKCGKSTIEQIYPEFDYVDTTPSGVYVNILTSDILNSTQSFNWWDTKINQWYPITISGSIFPNSQITQVDYCMCGSEHILKCIIVKQEDAGTIKDCDNCEFKFKCSFLSENSGVVIVN